MILYMSLVARRNCHNIKMHRLRKSLEMFRACVRMGLRKRATVKVAGTNYACRVVRSAERSADSVRIVIVSILPNQAAVDLVRLCIRSVIKYTDRPYEIWVVDNNSNPVYIEKLMKDNKVNYLLIRDDPGSGSYANGVALEAAFLQFPTDTRYCMTLHMDTILCHGQWLSYLMSKLNGKTKAVGVRMDAVRTPAGVVHILGCLFDFQEFRRLRVSVMPELPKYDVGDQITVAFRNAGYEVIACRNTHTNPELEGALLAGTDFDSLGFDRALDDENNVLFMHLGRGSQKVLSKNADEGSLEKWIRFAKEKLQLDPY